MNKKVLQTIQQAFQSGKTFLNLYDNKLTTLPPEIGQLTSLMVLYLSYNKLTTLPPEIGQLTSLTELNLSDNKLTALPRKIGQQLTSLLIYRATGGKWPPPINYTTL